MSKKAKSGPNKSEAIREHKAANPTASPKEIAEALVKTGIVVSAQFVSTVLSNAKKKGGVVGKRGRKPGNLGNGKKPAFSHDNLLQFKQAIDKYGGITAAKQAISALEELGVR